MSIYKPQVSKSAFRKLFALLSLLVLVHDIVNSKVGLTINRRLVLDK